MEDQEPTPPQDLDAPVRHTLPSGRVVEVRSTRTLTGLDSGAVLAAQTGIGARGVVDMYDALIARMVTQIEPGKSNAPALDGTIASAVAQRIDDHTALRGIVHDAYRLVNGTSVIPDFAEYDDPKAPITDSSEPRPLSEADSLA